METSPKSYPVVDFVLSKLASLGSRSGSPDSPFDIEQPQRQSSSASNDVRFVDPLVEKMPHLKDPKVIAEMAAAVSDIAKTRSLLQALGDRPDHETVDRAKKKVSEIETVLTNQLDEVALSSCSADVEGESEAAEKEKRMYKAVIQLDEMHLEFGKLLKDAEKRLMKIYDSAAAREGKEVVESSGEGPSEEMNEEVVLILEQVEAGRGIEGVDLSGRKLRFLPEAFGGIRGLVVLNLSNNQLQVIPETIAGLGLEELNLSCNLLESLPDSIGFLVHMKILNVSANKLTALPDSISNCRSLVVLDASFNNLGHLPTNIGSEMVNLRRLSVHYNKLRSLPISLGDMKSLQQLYAHFNELNGLPLSIGNLTDLATLNLSGNFSDLTELPETFGELTNLRELDLSNNQIHKLPVNFAKLENLTKLNLEQNPVVIPPSEVVSQGIGAIMDFMAVRRLNMLEEEEKNVLKMKEETEAGWVKRNFSRSTTWLKQQVSTASEYLGSPGGSPRDEYLNMQR